MDLQIVFDFIFGSEYTEVKPEIGEVLMANIIVISLYVLTRLAIIVGLYGVGKKIFGEKGASKVLIPFYGHWQLFYRVGLNPILSIFCWIPVLGLITMRSVFHYYVAQALGETDSGKKILAVVFPWAMIPYYGFNATSKYTIVRGSGSFKDAFRTVVSENGVEASRAAQAGMEYNETIEEMRARQAKEAEELAAKKKEQEEAEAAAKAAKSVIKEGFGTGFGGGIDTTTSVGPTTEIVLPISADGTMVDQAALAEKRRQEEAEAARIAAEKAEYERQQAYYAEQERQQQAAAAAAAEAEKQRQAEIAAAQEAEKQRLIAEEQAAAQRRAEEEAAARAREDAMMRMKNLAANRPEPTGPRVEPITMVSPATKQFTEPDSPEIEPLEDVAGFNDLPGAVRAVEEVEEPQGIVMNTIAPVPDVPVAQEESVEEASVETPAEPVTEQPTAPVEETPVEQAPVEQPVETPVEEQNPIAQPDFRGIESQIPEPIGNTSHYVQTADNIEIPKE